MKKRDTGINTLGFKEVSRADKRMKPSLDLIIKGTLEFSFSLNIAL